MQLKRIRAAPVVVGIVIVGVVATAVASLTVQNRSRAFADEWVADRAEVVRSEIESTVAELASGLEGVGAFIEVAAPVVQAEFAEYIGRVDERLSIIGVAYMPIVSAEELPAFEERLVATYPEVSNLAVRELAVTGEPILDLGLRDVYFPVEMFADGEWLRSLLPADEDPPFDLGVGIDGGSLPEWRESLVQSLGRGTSTVSDFVLIKFEEVEIGQAFLITVPVYEQGRDAPPTALVAAPMIDWLLPTQTDIDVSITAEVDWQIGSAKTGFGELADDSWVGEVDLPGATWQLAVAPSEAGRAGLAGTPSWIVVGSGLMITALAALAVGLVGQRRRSRMRMEEMQRIAEEKDRFLASVSHEIRTPLTSVTGLAHELRDRPQDFGAEEVKALISLIAEESDELSAIVEDLLVAARTDLDKVNIHAGRLVVGRALDIAIESSGVEAQLLGDPTVEAWADGQRVRQIVRNLLTNADRYGGDTIEVRVVENEHRVHVTVADSGDPIPDGKRGVIFEPYATAHSDERIVGSIGLGLYISRKLAGLMHGELTYTHDGSWSLFTLGLPLVAHSGEGPRGAGNHTGRLAS